VVFFAHHSHANTSHKEKKVHKKILHPPALHETHTAEEKKRLHDGARKKRERREKKKEEGRRKDLAGRGFARPSTGSRRKDLHWVSPGFFFFFLPVI
jgi:hypothetical protein